MEPDPTLLILIVIVVRIIQKAVENRERGRVLSPETLPAIAIALGIATVYGWRTLSAADRELVETGVMLGLSAVGGFAGAKAMLRTRAQEAHGGDDADPGDLGRRPAGALPQRRP